MHWTEHDTQQLIALVKEQKTIREIAAALQRSPEAIAMKLKRLGLQNPEKTSAKTRQTKLLKQPQQQRGNLKYQNLTRYRRSMMQPCCFGRHYAGSKNPTWEKTR